MSSFGDMQIALPGEILRESIDGLLAGSGTYVCEGGSLRSALAGYVVEETMEDGIMRVCVAVRQPAGGESVAADVAIAVGDIVLCRCAKIMANQVVCEILACNDTQLRTKAKGVVRREDVQPTETDQLVMADCYRPGDILRAQVISLGDKNQYFLSTAAPELGCRFARTKQGTYMAPAAAAQQQEPRKAAVAVATFE